MELSRIEIQLLITGLNRLIGTGYLSEHGITEAYLLIDRLYTEANIVANTEIHV